MNIQHIYKGLFLTLLLLAISIQVSAQCTINLTLNTKNTNCGDDGAVEAVISNLDQLTTLTYEVKKSGGAAITPPGTVSPLITGLAPGNYTLTVNGFCKAGGAAVTESKPFTIITGTVTGNLFKAGLNTALGKYRHTSLNNINTGKIAFDITGGSGQYLLELINPPVAYTGNTQFIVGAPGYFAVDHLPVGTYQIKISDGDCETIAFTQLVIKAVANADDLPANKAELFNGITQYVYPKANSPYPTEEFKKLRFNIFTSLKEQGFATQTDPSQPVNLNDYYNRVDAQTYYEFGFAYGTDPTEVKTWSPLKQTAPSPTFDDAIYPYSRLMESDYKQFIPYLFVRLKDKPSIYKVYEDHVNRALAYAKEVSMTSNGFRIRILANSVNRWWSYPCQLVAHNKTTGVKIIKKATKDDEIPLIIDLDWDSGRWDLYIEGLFPGDVDYNRSLGFVNLKTKDEFIDGLKINRTVIIDGNARPGYGDTYISVAMTPSNLYINNTDEFIFPQLKAKIDPNPNFPNNIGPEYTSLNSNTIHLTKSTYLPIAENNYTVTIQMYDMNNELAATKVLETIEIPDRGTMAAIDGASLTVNQILADVCYSRKISLDLDNIKSLFEMRLRDSTKTMTNVRIQIFKMEPDGITAVPATGVMTSNFTIKNSSETNIAYNFPTAAFNTANVTWHDASSDKNKPEFIISETGTFVVVATPIFNYSDLTAVGHPYGGMWQNTAIRWSSIIKDPYWHVKSSFTLDVNDLTKVRFDAEKTNGFRCSPTDIGTLNIGIESSSLPTAIMKYTVTSLDKLGNPTPYTKNLSTTDREVTWNDVPADVKFVKVSVETDDCINQPTVYTVQMYSLDNPAYLSSEGGYECIDGTTTHTPTDLKLKAVAILGTTYQWYYPDGTPVPSAAPYNGNTANATIPAAEIQLGDYSCAVLNPICESTTYTHKIQITDLGGDVFYWAVDAANSDWNNPANWRTWQGEVAPRIPDACTDVVIPGKVTAYYPDLQASSTTGNPSVSKHYLPLWRTSLPYRKADLHWCTNRVQYQLL